MNKYEVWKTDKDQYYLISTHSTRYESITKDKIFVDTFDLRNDAFNYLENISQKSVSQDKEKFYYEIYV